MDFDRTRERIARGWLPRRTEEWEEVIDDDGWTIAHQVATQRMLPLDFNQWAIADIKGWTVAHIAASQGVLPNPSLEVLMLADEDGLTVAHIQARYGRLQIKNDKVTTDLLNMTDKRGISVGMEYKRYSGIKIAELQRQLL